jgi:hypothetical protein
MKMPFYFSLTWLLLLCSGVYGQPERWVVKPGSNVHIYGSSNINSFHCACEAYSGRDTLIAICESGTREYIMGVIKLPSRGIDCGNAMMTSDLQRTIRAEEFPYLQIRLSQLQGELPTAYGTKPCMVALAVTLAGRTKSIYIPCSLAYTYGTTWVLRGRHTFLFNEFGLVPPQRLFGAVKVREELEVAFALELYMLPHD